MGAMPLRATIGTKSVACAFAGPLRSLDVELKPCVAAIFGWAATQRHKS